MGWTVELRLLVAAMAFMLAASGKVLGGEVTYDGRALIINGTRRMLFSGSIHYPRSTPDMWPNIIRKAKEGGLDVIQTYVFWNVHEPVQGQYDFGGRYDLVRFIKEVQNQGLYASLRIGPFIEAEWSYGGLPFWLHDVPGIVFRSDNEPFKYHMQKFVTMIVNLMKSNKLYASQGGPIIISQIENEYKNVEPAFHKKGPPYVRWAAEMAVDLHTGVPWMMCKQNDAPDPVINTCNGLNCGETFEGPNSPNKPSLWTENWTSRYPVYGEDPRGRSAQDIAFSVAYFIAKKKGSFINYYMYHGGTNFGKSASVYVTTSYYDLAPLDEYGLISLPTWGHLKELHASIKKSSDTLLWGKYNNFILGQQQEAHVFQTTTRCSAFLVNFDKHTPANVQFFNATYVLAAKSISILPDCKRETFNTAMVTAQHGTRTAKQLQYLDRDQQWQSFLEGTSGAKNAKHRAYGLLEQMSMTKDVTDYLWYTTSFNYTQTDGSSLIHIESLAHVLHVYVNDELIGITHGSHNGPQIIFEQPVAFKEGQNTISLLSVMVGLPDSGPYLERRFAGVHQVRIEGKGDSSQDLKRQIWNYQASLTGEKMQHYTEKGSNQMKWQTLDKSINQPLTWYKTMFLAPPGNEPLALDLSSMGKGEVWVNGNSIGRYWVSFKAPSGQPSQTMYHVPRSFLQPDRNFIVLFEEMGGDPRGITLNSISVDRVLSKMVQNFSPSLHSRNDDLDGSSRWR